jgi:hypothetical protein
MLPKARLHFISLLLGRGDDLIDLIMGGPFTETVWEVAFHRYKDGLDGSDLKRFERAFKDPSNYSDVLAIAETAATSSSHKFSGSLKAVLAPFVELAPVFDVVSQINGGVGCAVWGPMKLIIQVFLPLGTLTE